MTNASISTVSSVTVFLNNADAYCVPCWLVVIRRRAQELMANSRQYGEGDKLALYGLFKQAKWGDCPAGLVSAQRESPVGSVKVRAWVTNRGKATAQAMEEFIAVLGKVSVCTVVRK